MKFNYRDENFSIEAEKVLTQEIIDEARRKKLDIKVWRKLTEYGSRCVAVKLIEREDGNTERDVTLQCYPYPLETFPGDSWVLE